MRAYGVYSKKGKELAKIMKDGKLKALLLHYKKDPKSQVVIAATAQDICSRLRGVNSLPSLADTIVSQKMRSGGRTPFSEKQMDIIVEDFDIKGTV